MAQYVGSGDENYGELETFCDAILKTDDGDSFKVHRVILAKNSIYFRRLFLFGGRDHLNAEFTLSQFSGRTVKKVLQYLYHGKIILDSDNIFELLMASDYFLLDDLFLKYRKFLKENLSFTNCVKVFIASHINNRLDLYKSSRMLIRINFSKLLDQPTNDLPEIPFVLFKMLLEDNSLKIPDETYIWRAVEQWVGNSFERLPAVGELLSAIRFRNLNSHLVQYFQKSDILRKNPYLKEINSLLLLEELPDLSIVFKTVYPKIDFTRPRQPERLHLIAKITSEETDLYVTYNDEVCMRRKITLQAKNKFTPNQMAVVDHLAYLFDSETGKEMIFNLLDKTWNEMPPMNLPRTDYTVVHVGQFIYTLGGMYDMCWESGLSSAFERYDTQNQTWQHLCSTVIFITAASIGDKIYILFGSPTLDVTTADVYDTISGTFSTIPAPESHRTGCAMAVYDNQLFIVGGWNSYGSLKSVEVFSPETRVWKEFIRPPSLYESVKVIDGKLIVFDDARSIPPVFWSEKEKVWKPFQSKCFDPISKYLCSPIEDCDTITSLMKENLVCEQKWEFFEDEIF